MKKLIILVLIAALVWIAAVHPHDISAWFDALPTRWQAGLIVAGVLLLPLLWLFDFVRWIAGLFKDATRPRD